MFCRNVVLGLFLFLSMGCKSAAMSGSFASIYERFYEGKGKEYTFDLSDSWSQIVWRGERIQNQLVLDLGKPVNIKKFNAQLKLYHSKGKAVIGDDNIRFSYPGPVKGEKNFRSCDYDSEKNKPAERIVIYDALLHEKPDQVSDRLLVWVSIDVPEDAPPGKYQGDIELQIDSSVLTKKVELEVVDMLMPKDKKFHLDLWQYPLALVDIVNKYGLQKGEEEIKYYSKRHFSLVRPYYTLLAEAGQKTVTTYIADGVFWRKGNSMVDWTKTSDGWAFNFDAFEKYVSFMRDIGITKQISAFGLLTHEMKLYYYDADSGENLTLSYKEDKKEYLDAVMSFLSAFREFLVAKEWFDKTVLYFDEINTDYLFELTEEISQQSADWKMGVAGKWLRDEKEVYDFSNRYDTKNFVRYDTENKPPDYVRTFYTSCSHAAPNTFALPREMSDIAWIPWYVMRNGYDGYLRWAYDNFALEDPFDALPNQFTAGDFNIIYRSDNTTAAQPVSSIRFELLSKAAQDYEKLVKLSDNAAVRSYLKSFTRDSVESSSDMMIKADELLGKASREIVADR